MWLGTKLLAMLASPKALKRALLGLVVGALLFFWGHYGERQLPGFSSLQNPNVDPPKQTMLPASTPPEVLRFNEKGSVKTYTIYPRAKYAIEGLIVSQHRSESFWDSMHEQTGDYFNSRDFCIIWGKLLSERLYEEMSFRNGDWTCYAQAPPSIAGRVDYRELANNHVLAKDGAIRAALDAIEKGDEVRITGRLVDYDIDGRPIRKTSLVRDDTENGACETLYVESVIVIAAHGKWWKRLRILGRGLLQLSIATIIAIMATTVLRPHVQRL